MTRDGALYQGNNRCRFRVWAPLLQQVALEIAGPGGRDLPLEKDETGYWQIAPDDVPPGTRYWYVLNGGARRPDPASCFQPEGVHGPSEVINHGAFQWTDAGWEGVPLEDLLIYEMHVGTFTPQGTFDAIIPRLAALKELGITAIELMPVSQFPGHRNWGYDGVYPYAVQNSYGGPDGLKTLVNAIHYHGMSAILDVVYNHLGPEGNYLRDFGLYFTGKYKTPWGDAINYDGAYSDHVRRFFIQNALFWLCEYHFDALRLDALHQIYDQSAKHILQELAEHVAQFTRESGRKHYLIGESDLNDVRLIKPPVSGGYGLDAQWSDDFHHCVHSLLTGERSGYYEDFGRIEQLAKALREGFVYTWEYSPHRKKFHGSSSRQRPARQFVVCVQNHDQVGNRGHGERLSQLVDFESLKLAAGVLLLSPYIPLLFMGEEYGEDAPFPYFAGHTDEALVAAVREGRKVEFEALSGAGEIPDPFTEEIFQRAKPAWEKRSRDRHAILLAFYRCLVEVRNSIPHMVSKTNTTVQCLPRQRLLTWHRTHVRGRTQCVMNFSNESQTFLMGRPQSHWVKILDSADSAWAGPGSILPNEIAGRQRIVLLPRSVAVFAMLSTGERQAEAAQTAAATRDEATDAYPAGDL
ncbi:MAG: malto-oligosyltrehalose trehalohydrolase [Planctomycetes bacterium RBG_13_62_9]|nr:MAG: malto-oligosyltrehalose trehalohydrolase [Planctomycetes bacterium RBG_13_62_9]